MVVSRRCDGWEMGIDDDEEVTGMTADAGAVMVSTSGAHEGGGTVVGDYSYSEAEDLQENEVDGLEVCASACSSSEGEDFVSYEWVGCAFVAL